LPFCFPFIAAFPSIAAQASPWELPDALVLSHLSARHFVLAIVSVLMYLIGTLVEEWELRLQYGSE
jgi:hypothetical protein